MSVQVAPRSSLRKKKPEASLERPDLGRLVFTDDEDDDEEAATIAGSGIIHEGEPRNLLGAEVPEDQTRLAVAYRLRFATWWGYP